MIAPQDRPRWALLARATALALAEHRGLLARMERDGTRPAVRIRVLETIRTLEHQLLDERMRASGVEPPARRERRGVLEHATLFEARR